MNPFKSLRRRRAAKDYVFKLGPWLRQAYGASTYYKPGQIDRGVRDLNLDPKLIALGYAVFLDPSVFDVAIGKLADRSAIDEAHAALRRKYRGDPQYDPMPDDLEQASELARVYREIARQIESDADQNGDAGGDGADGGGGD
jgi:hypothetical protein